MRTSRVVMGFLGLLAVACVGEPRLSCIDDYILDGERCVFRGGATGEPEDAGTPEPDADAGDAGDTIDAGHAVDAGEPADAEVACDASADAAEPPDDAGGCPESDAGEQRERALR